MDRVKCSWCEFEGTVETGEERCPSCKRSGVLAWVDENEQEVKE